MGLVIRIFFRQYSDIFNEESGLLKGIEATITADKSVVAKLNRHQPMPFALKDKVKEALQTQVMEGKLIVVEQSEWAAPIVVVMGDSYLWGLQSVSESTDLTTGVPLKEIFSTNGESFSKLDLSWAYKQMRVAESSQPLLTINTHIGLFQYTRLPFGISTAPVLWQKAMAQVLHGVPGQVLIRIREYGLRLNKNKCVLFQNKLEFLHLISSEGILSSQHKVE